MDPFIDFLHEALIEECVTRDIQVFDAVSGYTDAILTASGDEMFRNVVPAGVNWADIRMWAKMLDVEGRISCVISESDVGVSAAERVQEALVQPTITQYFYQHLLIYILCINEVLIGSSTSGAPW